MSNPLVVTAGQGLYIPVSITDQNGNPVDPTTLTFSYRIAGATTVWTYGGAGSIVRDSQGNYHVNLDTTAWQGQLLWAYEASGNETGYLSGIVQIAPRPL